MATETVTTSIPNEAPESNLSESSSGEGLGITEESGETGEGTEGSTEGSKSFEEWLAGREEKETKAVPDSRTEKEPVEEVKEPEAVKPPTHKVKVNGEEKEVSTEDLIREYQKGRAGDKKLQEASEQIKKAESVLGALKGKPELLLKEMSVAQIEEYYFKNVIEPTLLSPEERALREREAKLANDEAELTEYRTAKQRAQEEAQEREIQAKTAERKTQLQASISSALSVSGIPESHWSVTRTIDYMKHAISQGYKDITPEQVSQYVKQDWIAEQQSVLQGMDPVKLVEILGEDAVAKLRRHGIDEAKAKKFQNNAKPGAVKREEKPGKKYTSIYDMVDEQSIILV